MKQALMKKLTPIIEEFAGQVLSSFGDIEKIRADIKQKELLYQDLISQREKELSDIRVRKAEERKNIDSRITDLEQAKNNHNEKAKLYDSLNKEAARKRKSIDDDLDNSRLELIRAKDIRSQAEEKKAAANKSKNNYELKLNSLKQDDEKIEKEKEENLRKEKSYNERQKDIFSKESRNEQRAADLNDQELKIQVERKEINRLIKRYNLKESLKGE